MVMMMGPTVWLVLELSVLMQQQAHQHILPVQACKPAGGLLGLLLVQVDLADHQLDRLPRQQVAPA